MLTGLTCLLLALLPIIGANADAAVSTLQPASPQVGWRVKVQRTVKHSGTEHRNGQTVNFDNNIEAQWLDDITHTKYRAVTRTERKPLKLEILRTGQTEQITVPAGQLSAFHNKGGWRLFDAERKQIEDKQLLAALGGGPSLQLWPSGPLRVGRRWCLSKDELEIRLVTLGIRFGSLNLSVDRIQREPATGLQTAYLLGELYAILPHRGVDTQLRARVEVDVPLKLGMALRVDISGRFSADLPDRETKDGRLIVDGRYLFRQTLSPSRAVLASLNGNAGPKPTETPSPPASKAYKPKFTAGLHTALKHDNYQQFELMLRLGADPNTRGPSGCPILHEIIQDMEPDVGWFRASALIKYGADINAQCPELSTPLLLAIDQDKPLNPIISGLLKAGADPNKPSAKGETPLMRAMQRFSDQTELVRLLLKAGAGILHRDKDGNNILAQAMLDADTDTLELLLQSGVDLHGPNKAGEPPLLLAARMWDQTADRKENEPVLVEVIPGSGRKISKSIAASNYSRSLRLLLKHGADLQAALDAADPNSRARQRLLAAGLREAVSCGDLGAASSLLQQGADPQARWDNDRCSLLDTALLSMGDEAAMVDLLLQSGAPVHQACHQSGPPLVRAASTAPIGVLQELLRYRADVNAQAGDGQTALMQALMRNDPREETAAVKLLLSAGADVHRHDKEGDTALHRAALVGNPTSIRDILAAGARIDATDKLGNTPLMTALSMRKTANADALIQAGADLNRRDGSGAPLLHAAARGGELDLVNRLLQAGADIHARDSFGRTALQRAAEDGRIEVMDRLLVLGADANAVDHSKSTPLIMVSDLIDWEYQKGTAAVAMLLTAGAWLDQQNKDGDTALMKMARRGHAEGAKQLLDAGANIHLRNVKKETALHAATDRQDKSGKIIKAQRRIIKWLIEAGADPNAQDFTGTTALMQIAERSSPLHDIYEVERLLQLGADPALKDNYGKTAKDRFSPLSHREWIERASRLEKPLVRAWMADDHQGLKAKASPLNADQAAPPWQVDARDDNGHTRLMRAAKAGYPTSIRYFLERGAAVNETDRTKTTPLMLAALNGHAKAVELLLRWNADPALYQENGFSALVLATIVGEADAISALLNHGVPVDQTDADGHTALWHAASHGHPETARLLLDRGADINAGDGKGWTPLMAAAMEDDLEMTRLLLDRGADPKAKTDKGISAEIIAMHKKFYRLLKLFQGAGNNPGAGDQNIE